MEIQSLKVNEKLKISGKTISELLQAIANLTRQNIRGRYDERISAYRQALEQYKSIYAPLTLYESSPDEAAAIMYFNKDRRYKITE